MVFITKRITMFYNALVPGWVNSIMAKRSGKYLYSIRSANGVLVENLQVYGKSRAEADEKIRQMYWRCEILSCKLVADLDARAPNLKMQWVRPAPRAAG
jgi:hypothetical protein